jgi:hypothetical protein
LYIANAEQVKDFTTVMCELKFHSDVHLEHGGSIKGKFVLMQAVTVQA